MNAPPTLGKCPFACHLEGRGMSFPNEWSKCSSCSKTVPSLEKLQMRKTMSSGCNSEMCLRKIIEQNKTEECLSGFITFLRAWQRQVLTYWTDLMEQDVQKCCLVTYFSLNDAKCSMIMEKEMRSVICSVASVHMAITESKIRLAGIFAVYFIGKKMRMG